jgi:serine/threonine protein kinase
MSLICRDLKLKNVLVDAEGHGKLAEFGLSKFGMFPGHTIFTHCGSLPYVAPEVISPFILKVITFVTDQGSVFKSWITRTEDEKLSWSFD